MKRFIMLLIITFSLPILVTAHEIEDLELKWNTKIEFNDFYSLNSEGIPETLYVNDYLYITFGDESITWINKLTGTTDTYKIYNCIVNSNTDLGIYILGKNDTGSVLLQLDEKGMIKKEIFFDEQQSNELIIKDEKIIAITYKSTDDKKYEYYVNVYDKELNQLEIHTKKIPTYIYPCGDKNYSFYDYYKNYYYLNENNEIVPYIVKENGDYTIFKGNSLQNVDKDGNIKKEYLVSDSYYSSAYKELEGKKYVIIGKRISTASANYNYTLTLYVLDDDLNLLTQKELMTKENSKYYETISSNMYLNENKIVIKIDNNYYELDNSYNLVPTTSSEAKDSFTLSYDENEDNYYDNEYYEKKEYIGEALATYSEKNISEEMDDFEFGFVEYQNNYYASVTWRYDCYDDYDNNYCYTHEDLIKLDKDFNIEKVKKHSAKKLINEVKYSYDFSKMGNLIREFNGYIIMTSGGPYGNTLKLYDTELNVIKNFNDVVSDSVSAPRAIIKSKNGFLLMNRSIEIAVNISSDSIGDIEDNLGTELYYFEFPYEITTKVNGKGKIEIIEDKSRTGEQVKFKVIPESGYVLSEVKVTDTDGNILVLTDYEFTMPTSDVVIEATFVPEILENPSTKDSIIIISFITIILLVIIKYLKNKQRFNIKTSH